MMYEHETDHRPRHLKRYEYYMSHCCFGGCTPMGCPKGCCIQEFGHKPDCPVNPWRVFDEAEHDAYVAAGLRKHLAETPEPYYNPSRDWGALPLLRPRCAHVVTRPARREEQPAKWVCKDCGAPDPNDWVAF